MICESCRWRADQGGCGCRCATLGCACQHRGPVDAFSPAELEASRQDAEPEAHAAHRPGCAAPVGAAVTGRLRLGRVYVGPEAVYVCPLPMLVVRISR